MNLQHAARQATVSPERSEEAHARLHGRRLVVARVGLVALVIPTLVVFIAILPVYVGQLQTLCLGNACAFGQLATENVGVLQGFGLSLSDYAAFRVTLTIISAFVWFAVGGVLFWRRSDEGMALLVAFTLMLQGTTSVTSSVQSSPSVWQVPAQLLNILAYVVFFLAFCRFPDGRFLPRWTRWLMAGYIVVSVGAVVVTFFPGLPFSDLFFFLGVGCFGLLGVAQVYRYWRLSSRVQRQQTKWVVFAGTVVIIVLFGRFLPELIFPSLNQSSSLYDLTSGAILSVVTLLIPLAIGIAILRSRLWDIDVIINRTLVYGVLTGTLALVYVGLVIGLQALLRGIISQDNSVAIVISTLAIATLFQPLRHHLQKFIDRRFYRSKYDAAKIIEAFSATLRNEVDLDQLREQLLAVVQETMQPAHVSLWLRPPQQSEKRTTHPWRANPPVSSEVR